MIFDFIIILLIILEPKFRSARQCHLDHLDHADRSS